MTSGDFSGRRKLADACGERFTLGLALYDHDTVVPFRERLFAAPVSTLGETSNSFEADRLFETLAAWGQCLKARYTAQGQAVPQPKADSSLLRHGRSTCLVAGEFRCVGCASPRRPCRVECPTSNAIDNAPAGRSMRATNFGVAASNPQSRNSRLK